MRTKKNLLLFTFLSAISLFLLLTCHKEYSYESNRAKGSLQDSAEICLPKLFAGRYVIDSALTDSNYIRVEIRVDKPGVYEIYTDTINGYYFHASGFFEATGMSFIQLKGFGKPSVTGTDDFTVFFDSSSCVISNNILLEDTLIKPSQYSLLGDTCIVDSLLGFYIKGVPVSDTARLSFPVDVKTPGSYIIYTDTVFGYSFSAKGEFTSTGKQNVVLHCYGTPQNVGTDVFKLTADSAVCYFSVPVLLPVVPTTNDHFPLSINSYWSYNDVQIKGDTTKTQVTGVAIFNGSNYQDFNILNENGQQKQSYFRKNGNDYFEYCSGDKYTSAVKFKTPVNGDLFFLKEGIRKNEQWISMEYEGITPNNQKKSIQYSFKCLYDNNYYVINNIAYSNVYVTAMFPMVRENTGEYLLTGEETDTYYARGIGIIYQQSFTNEQPVSDALQLRYWIIN